MHKSVKLRAVSKYRVDVNKLASSLGIEVEARVRDTNEEGYWEVFFKTPVTSAQAVQFTSAYEASLVEPNVVWDDDPNYEKTGKVFNEGNTPTKNVRR